MLHNTCLCAYTLFFGLAVQAEAMLHTTDAAYAFNSSSTSSSSTAKDKDTQQNRTNQQQQSMLLDTPTTATAGETKFIV
jgi:hypothetical protein